MQVELKVIGKRPKPSYSAPYQTRIHFDPPQDDFGYDKEREGLTKIRQRQYLRDLGVRPIQTVELEMFAKGEYFFSIIVGDWVRLQSNPMFNDETNQHYVEVLIFNKTSKTTVLPIFDLRETDHPKLFPGKIYYSKSLKRNARIISAINPNTNEVMIEICTEAGAFIEILVEIFDLY